MQEWEAEHNLSTALPTLRETVAWLYEGESTESNGCRNKQLDSTYELHSQPEEIVCGWNIWRWLHKK